MVAKSARGRRRLQTKMIPYKRCGIYADARLHQRAVTEPSLAKRLTSPSSAPPKDYDILAGGTLIVRRGKEDIEQWEFALREYTSLSVLSK